MRRRRDSGGAAPILGSTWFWSPLSRREAKTDILPEPSLGGFGVARHRRERFTGPPPEVEWIETGESLTPLARDLGELKFEVIPPGTRAKPRRP